MTKHRQHFVDLLDRLKTDILKIDNSAINWIDTVNDNTDTCNQLIKELRERYEQISLSKKEQITFFKEIKPLFSSELLFLGLVLRYYKESLPMDPQFSSPADPTLSLILANEKFLQFLRLEYALVADTTGSSNGKSKKSPNLPYT